MLNSLMQTKLYVPHTKARLVSRPRLLGKLDSLQERKLTLISAPAGFGKTTLLSEWIEHQAEQPLPLEVAWLSLDASDNNPVRFLTYFVGALQKAGLTVSDEVLPALQAFQVVSIQEIWELLASKIAYDACQIVLVLDDYHVIDSPAIHESVAYLLEQMPPCMHLVISTRADPPLPLSRLRVRGELVEIRASDLRFSSQEIADFIGLWIGENLPAAGQEELEARTEGWIAGLQLAALAMQSLAQTGPAVENGLTAFVHRLSGSNRFIMDYLVEEVLQRQPADMRGFLLQTSVLDNLTASLCDAVTGRQDSQGFLDALEKTNCFLFPLDDERGWYRYHHLFADVLRCFLKAGQVDQIPELHARASAWYESQNLINEAIDHALRVPNPNAAARLMEQAALATILGGDVTAIQNWSMQISEEQARQRPFLCCCFAWGFLISDKLEQAERFLALVDQDQSFHLPSAYDLHGLALSADSMLAFLKGEYEHAIHFARQAMDKLSPELNYLRGVLAYSSGAAYEMVGEDEVAFQSCLEAKQISHAFGNRTAEISAVRRMGDIQVRRGQLHQAMLSYQQALQTGSIREGLLLPAHTVSALGRLLYEWNQLEEARRYLNKGVELSRRLRNQFALLSSLQNLARVQWAQGDRESALRLRQEAEHAILESPPLPSCAAQVAVQQVRIYLQMGETQAAVHWAQRYAQGWKSLPTYPRELMAILWARVGIAQGDAAGAIEALELALPVARAAGRWGVLVELLVLKALALALARQNPLSLAALEEALRLGEPQGYARIFLDEGEAMGRLLRMVYRSKEKGARAYVARLLEGLLPEDAGKRPVSSGEPAAKPEDHLVLIDPLSDREVEILRMIADGHSNLDIAEQLFITLGTVKAHISHIYTKLDVRSRTQATIKANQIGLLNP